MAKRSAVVNTVTLTGYADAASIADNTYCAAFVGGSATQRTNFLEVYVGGQSSSSAVSIMILGRDSTAAATAGAGTGYSDSPLDASTAALAAPMLSQNAWTTKPQRGSTHLLNLTFNAFGGIVRWVAAPGEEISQITATQPLGCTDLSAFTGSPGIVGAHVIYETL